MRRVRIERQHGRDRRFLVPLLGVATLLAGLLATGPAAQATVPGTNGRIAYSRFADATFRHADIVSTNPDGTGLRKLTKTPAGTYDFNPDWSPHGTKVAFERDTPVGGGIDTVNADGSNLRQITFAGFGDQDPAWSPDGTRIAVERFDIPAGRDGIYVIDSDGSNPVQVTQNDTRGENEEPQWSPDGTKLVFQIASDTLGHALPTVWKVTANLVFRVQVHTVPVKYPALVQVPNDPGAWDQSGLQAADMVFEYVAEGGITRFTAVFTNVPDKVGPVRSARLISIKLTKHYHGELFLSGTSEGTFGVLQRSGIRAQFDEVGVYYRTNDHRAPDNLYINADAIQRAEGNAADFKLPTGKPGLTGGQPAASVSVPEHSSTYAFDAATGTYNKTEGGHGVGDAAVGAPVRISMVIVLRTQVTTTGIIEDVNGARGLDYDIDGSGSADIYYQGAKFATKWSSPNTDSPLVFTNDAGQPIALPPGPVWIDVVPG